MSSLLAAAAPAPTDPQVNGASLIHADVNPAGAMCTYTARMFRPLLVFVRSAYLMFHHRMPSGQL